MAENKTQPTQASVRAFLDDVANATRRRDAEVLVALMQRVSGVAPEMWGPSIIGFGRQHYRYESGREGDMPRIGFSPRQASLVLYLGTGPETDGWLAQLGKHKTGASCLYVNKLSDVNEAVLKAMITDAWQRSGRTAT